MHTSLFFQISFKSRKLSFHHFIAMIVESHQLIIIFSSLDTGFISGRRTKIFPLFPAFLCILLSGYTSPVFGYRCGQVPDICCTSSGITCRPLWKLVFCGSLRSRQNENYFFQSLFLHMLYRNGIGKSTIQIRNPVYIYDRTYKWHTAAGAADLHQPVTVILFGHIFGIPRKTIGCHDLTGHSI